ncbi:MAG: hypothetical protein CM1200mP39_13870 [Dehalococcoidia bacterium]|nr:MAG: hypothetical protein CM1200mP39_13870 [Dehalococcoidia bacterium]
MKKIEFAEIVRRLDSQLTNELMSSIDFPWMTGCSKW